MFSEKKLFIKVQKEFKHESCPKERVEFYNFFIYSNIVAVSKTCVENNEVDLEIHIIFFLKKNSITQRNLCVFCIKFKSYSFKDVQKKFRKDNYSWVLIEFINFFNYVQQMLVSAKVKN